MTPRRYNEFLKYSVSSNFNPKLLLKRSTTTNNCVEDDVFGSKMIGITEKEPPNDMSNTLFKSKRDQRAILMLKMSNFMMKIWAIGLITLCVYYSIINDSLQLKYNDSILIILGCIGIIVIMVSTFS